MIFGIGVVLTVIVFLWMFVGGNITAVSINLVVGKYENIPLVAVITGSFGIGFLVAYLMGLYTYFGSILKDLRIKNLEKALSEQQTRLMQMEESLAKERQKAKDLASGKKPEETTALTTTTKTSLVKVIKDNLNISKWIKPKESKNK